MACHHAITWMAWIVHHGTHHNSLLEELFRRGSRCQRRSVFQRLGLESETGPWVTRAPLVSSPRAQGPVRELIQLRRHHNPVKIHAMACHHAMTWMAWIVHHGAHHNSLLEEFFELCVPTSALVSMAAPAPASVSVRCQCQRQYRCQCQRQCQRQHQSQCQCQYQ